MSEATKSHHPADFLLNLIVTLLTPMFLTAAGNDLAFARQAARQTLNDYRAETRSDLITVAKIIGFGLAALAALSLSMAEDLSIKTVLRLHASANASDRSEHRNRQVLKTQVPSEQPSMMPQPDIDEAALQAAAAEMKTRTGKYLSHFTTPTITDRERQDQLTWATSAAAIAAETAATLPTLPQGERASAAIWIEVLNESAKDFLAGNILAHPWPGDHADMMPPPDQAAS